MTRGTVAAGISPKVIFCGRVRAGIFLIAISTGALKCVFRG